MTTRPKSPAQVILAAAVLGLALSALNTALPQGPGGAIIFSTILLLALWSPQRGVVFMLTAMVVALITLDAWLCPYCPTFGVAVSERLPAVALALVSSLLLYARPGLAPPAPQAGKPVPEGLGERDDKASQRDQMAGMAHEVRSPLNAIVGFAQIIEQELYGPLGDDRYKEYARNIQTSGQHILSVTDDYLGLARLSSGRETLHLARVRVDRLIKSVTAMIEPLALNAYVEIEIDTPDDLPDLRADSSKVAQILLNLLVNAIKFTDGGGRVTISAMTDFGGHMILIVSDNGVGMTMAESQAVIEPFARTETPGRPREGTGLGLSLVRSLVELHDGDFWLESALGIGTKAFIRMPSSRVLPPKQADAGPGPGDFSGGRGQLEISSSPSM